MRLDLFILFTTVGGILAQQSTSTQDEPPRETPTELPWKLPQVEIKNGTVIGLTDGIVDTFKSIPFAMPPVGSRRLQPPEPLNASFGTIYATSIPMACPVVFQGQNPWAIAGVPFWEVMEINSYFPQPYYTGENCLTLNIQRPAGAKAGAKIPVLVWIYGGGFQSGATQIYDFTNVITNSLTIDHPVIVVMANYRQGVFGFLAGKEIYDDGATNLGLRDQRLALKWVAENIEAFGGDPDKVTIWGQSAGAVSVMCHTIINGGDHTYNGKPLFRGAIMDSGASQPAMPIDSPVAQDMYNYVISQTSCANATKTLDCLRNLPYGELAWAAAFVPSLINLQGLAFSFAPRPSPEDPFLDSTPEEAFQDLPPRIARIPIINGVQDDEGTVFGIGLLTAGAETTEGFINALENLYPYTGRDVLAQFVDMYSTNVSAGSPFNTGATNEIYSGYKRNSAVLGDLIFNFHRRAYLSAVSHTVRSWSYMASYRKQPVLGTFHGSDLMLLAEKWPWYPYYDIWQYYVSFVHYGDPNTISHTEGGRQLAEWPMWRNNTRQMMEFTDYGERVIKDDARQTAYEYFRSRWSMFGV